MARENLITRTIKTTKVNVLCMDLQKGDPFNKVVILPRTFKDDKSLMKVVSKQDNDTTKAVHIVDKEEIETLYGMTESQFIELSSELNKETRKPL